MSDSIRPDEVITPGGNSLQLQKLAVDSALIFPNLVKLFYRLLRDPRVPRRSKVVVGAALAYAASPIDVFPDIIPVLGRVDDVLIGVFAINNLIKSVGEDVILEHWDGAQDLLGLVRGGFEVASDLVPGSFRKLFFQLSGR